MNLVTILLGALCVICIFQFLPSEFRDDVKLNGLNADIKSIINHKYPSFKKSECHMGASTHTGLTDALVFLPSMCKGETQMSGNANQPRFVLWHNSSLASLSC